MVDIPHLLAALGTFHPLLVHLPIGLLLGAAALECWSIVRARPELRAASGALLELGAAAAVVAAACGLLLAESGGYDAALLERHQRLGLATAALAVLAAALHRWSRRAAHPRRRTGARLALAACTVALCAAGHFGGVITHGTTTPFALLAAALRGTPAAAPAPVVAAHSAEALFADVVAPLLANRCHECHGEQKQKSGLRLDSRAAALAGGDSGSPAVVPGEAVASRMVEAITLPSAHKRAMPPAGKQRLEPAQVMAIIEWINGGAPWPDTAQPDIPPPSAAALEDLRAAGYQLSPLAEGSPLVRIDAVPSGARLADLAPLAPHIAWLDLAGFQLAAEDTKALAGMPNLARLELQHSNVADADLARLAGLAHLVALNLYGTAVGDAGLEHLRGLRSLGALYLWQTRVTPPAVGRLRAALPATRIDTGDTSSGTPPPLDPTPGPA